MLSLHMLLMFDYTVRSCLLLYLSASCCIYLFLSNFYTAERTAAWQLPCYA